MIVTELQLMMIMPKAKKVVGTYLPLINRFAEEFRVNTPLRMAHFLAQIAVESGELQFTKENLNYSAQGLLKTFPRYFNTTNVGKYERNAERIGNKVYANRMGNDDEASGDGYRFRGRGLIQLTGKNMYISYTKYCGVDLLKQPELLEKPFGATRSAFWYFSIYSELLDEADRDDIITITKRVNGGLNGITQRKEYLRRAKMAFKIK